MKFDIVGGDSYPVLEVGLSPGEKIVSESGAMSWMDHHVQCKTSTRGGMLSGLGRKFLTGESFFQNEYHVEGKGGTVGLVPGAPGTICHYPMDGGELLLEKGAYLASTPGVEIKTKFEGLSFKAMFNEGLFILKAVGTGDLFFSGYGHVQPMDVDGEYVVDNGYAVAWEPSLSYELIKAKKIRAFLFGDQLMLKFRGTGKLWVQSRSPQSLANFFFPYRPVKSN
jgi:uncharacterized protein (TIGR00266 family)